MMNMFRAICLFFLIATLASKTFAAAPQVLFLNLFNSVLAAPPHGTLPHGGADEFDLQLRIFPGGTSIPNLGENVNQVQSLSQAISGVPFHVVVLVVDSQNRRVDKDGHFKLSWSNNNYVNPSNPPARYNPIRGSLHRSFRFDQGLLVIPYLRYDECGMIRITGTAKIKAYGPPGNINLQGKSNPFVVRPYQLILQSDLPTMSNDDEEFEGNHGRHRNRWHRNDEDDENEDEDEDEDDEDDGNHDGHYLNHPAGTTFSLKIFAVNANMQITTNYPYDDLINLNQKFLAIRFNVVMPEGVQGGELHNAQNVPFNQFPASLFTYGECTLNNISYTDVGIIDIIVEDMNYMGSQITGVLQRVGRFVPHHFDIEVDQPAMIQAEAASYTYSGQPFSATAAITAKNGKTPPGTTVNYQGEFAQAGNPRLTVALPPHQNMLGNLDIPSVSTPIFDHGIATVSINELIFQYSNIQNPTTLSVRYTFHGRGEMESFTDSSPVEFRCGRMHIHDRSGIAGDFLKLFVDVEYFRDDEWGLNQDEEVLRISPNDFSIEELPEEANILIEGTERRFFGGMIRGGYTPLRIDCSNLADPIRFRITQSENSLLHFLEMVPGYWYIVPSISAGRHTGYLMREQILYEKEI